MIDRLEGEVVYVRGVEVGVKVGPLIFSLSVPTRLCSGLKIGRKKLFYVDLVLKQNELKLYGFADEEERETFRKLRNVPGVGDRRALRILSSLSPGELMEFVFDGNVVALSSLPGIGKKTAARIISELSPQVVPREGIYNEVREALLSLGFSNQEVNSLLKKIRIKEGQRVEEVLKDVLRGSSET